MTERAYNPQEIEPKWQKVFERENIYAAGRDPGKPKYYVLEMLPYPSGTLHMGHVRNYSIGDALARYKWMRGYNVLHPMGWDAFGLPAENAAIQNNTHPREWTLHNIAFMKQQHRRFSFAYDWTKELSTCEPEYYRWNQWFFLRMYERGLAYRRRSRVNWCPKCQTVLANEQVHGGYCWRHEETLVAEKELEQWFLRITDYADQLLDDMAKLKRWPEKVLTMQRNWIGRSVGAQLRFPVAESGQPIEVFTTRIDTIYGATAVILAPEHPLVDGLIGDKAWSGSMRAQVRKLIDSRIPGDADYEKQGLFTGRFAVNPFTKKLVPIWVGNFVLMEYGTGAIMAVPAHDQRDYEFCSKYHIPIPTVIEPLEGKAPANAAFTDYGRLVDSGPYSGLTSQEGIQKMTAGAEREGFGRGSTTYRLKDWGISRQRYWGTPIPIVYCAGCGIVPVPDDRLPVALPTDVQITGMGESPLARHESFVNTTCPKCGGPGRRETDTMDTFVDSSWYFYRYTNPAAHSAPIDREAVAYWFPIDQYIGGVEHAIMHLIYSRFWTKIMRDLGLTGNDEPVERLFTQGMVIREGAKMSKSKGNVVDPDEMVKKYGADATRLYVLFAAPPAKDLDWSESGIEGIDRFLQRVYRFAARNLEKARQQQSRPAKRDQGAVSTGLPAGDAGGESAAERAVRRRLHQTIRRITDDFEDRWHFNTSIAALMELMNELYASEEQLSPGAIREALEALVKLLAPFAPFFSQELWSMLGRETILLRESWPSYDPELARVEEYEIVVQVNGRLRSRMVVTAGTPQDEVQRRALADPRVVPLMAGKQLVRAIVVPNKLVNLVIRG